MECVLTMGYHKPDDFDITEASSNRKCWLYIRVGSASATSIHASNTLCMRFHIMSIALHAHLTLDK